MSRALHLGHLTIRPCCRELRLWTRTLDKYTRAGLLDICGQQNVEDVARDNTGQSKKVIHPAPE